MQSLMKRLSFLGIVMVLAIATLGAAYTLWYEDLELHADVTTGTLEGTINCATDLDNEEVGWPAPGVFGPVGQPFDSYPKADPLKDVADVPVSGNTDLHTWQIALGNTYPGYMYDCELHIVNIGSVPWHVEIAKIEVMGPGGYSVIVDCLLQDPCALGDRDPYTPGLSPIYVEIENFAGCQVHGGNNENASLFIGVNQSALEASLYKVWLTYRVNQWNESAWIDCGEQKSPFVPVLPG